MYKTGTVLVLKEQRKPEPRTNRDGETITGPDGKPIEFDFPYNRVKVIGASPISYGDAGWEGTGSNGVIIQPITDFAGNLDEPFGKLQLLYDVETIPPPVETKTTVTVLEPADLGATPEEVFKKESPGVPPEKGQIRGRTNPLGDPTPPEAAGPLGKVEAPKRTKKPARPSPLD